MRAFVSLQNCSYFYLYLYKRQIRPSALPFKAGRRDALHDVTLQ